jgi:hypothetical protein
MLRLISDRVEFYEKAAIIQKHLPEVIITNEHKIICDDGRYYGMLAVNDEVGIYDHVILNSTVSNPEFIFKVFSYIFSQCVICNSFIDTKNMRARRYVQGLGFDFMGYLPYKDKTCAIYSMSIQKWLDNPIRNHYLKRESN